MFTGTLYDLLVYPRLGMGGGARADVSLLLRELVAELDLDNVGSVAGWGDATCNWGSTLSPGEQQRVALVRLVLARPQLAVLDEAFTALDPDMVERCLSMLRRHLPRATLLFVSHSARLAAYCERTVTLRRQGQQRRDVPQ